MLIHRLVFILLIQIISIRLSAKIVLIDVVLSVLVSILIYMSFVLNNSNSAILGWIFVIPAIQSFKLVWMLRKFLNTLSIKFD